MIEDYEELQQRVAKLHALLDNPQPGLITWMTLFMEHMAYIAEYWTGEEQSCE